MTYRRAIAPPRLLVSALVAALIPLCLAADADASTAAACRPGTMAVTVKGTADCVSTQGLARGVPSSPESSARAIVRGARASAIWRSLRRRTVDTALGRQAPALTAWQDRAAAAGRRAALASAQATARHGLLPGTAARVQAGAGDVDVSAPSGWISRATATLTEGIGGLLEPGEETVATGGELRRVTTGARYTFSVHEESPNGYMCPSEKGVVRATGAYAVKRTARIENAPPVSETASAVYVVSGNVGADARLKSYDIEINLTTKDSGGNRWDARAVVKGLKPGGVVDPTRVAVAIGPPKVPMERSMRTRARAELVTLTFAFLQHARATGEDFLRKAEARYYDQAACLEVQWAPSTLKMKPGTTIDADLLVVRTKDRAQTTIDVGLRGTGGAIAAPGRATTRKGAPARVKVTAPPRGYRGQARRTSALRSPAAAAAASVQVDGTSVEGRVTGALPIEVEGDEGPWSYRVVDVYGTVDATSLRNTSGSCTFTASAMHIDVGAPAALPDVAGTFTARNAAEGPGLGNLSVPISYTKQPYQTTHGCAGSPPTICNYGTESTPSQSLGASLRNAGTGDVSIEWWMVAVQAGDSRCGLEVADLYLDAARRTTTVPFAAMAGTGRFTIHTEGSEPYTATQGITTHTGTVTWSFTMVLERVTA